MYLNTRALNAINSAIQLYQLGEIIIKVDDNGITLVDYYGASSESLGSWYSKFKILSIRLKRILKEYGLVIITPPMTDIASLKRIEIIITEENNETTKKRN